MQHIDKTTLLNAQMRMAIDGYLPASFITLTTTFFLYSFLSPYATTDKIYIQLWGLMQISLSGIWLFLYLRYRHDFSAIAAIWERRIEIPLNVFSGLGWGLIWVLFINPDNLNTVILLNVVTSSALFVYIVSTPLHPAATHTGLAFCIVPIIIECFSIGTPLFIWIGIGGVILSSSIYLFGKELHKVYLHNLIQLEENNALVAALEKEKQHVEDINQEKTRFLAAASHDLRQPIQAVRLWIELLTPNLKEAQQQDIANKIKQANQSLLNLLDPLLELSKLDAGAIQLQPEWLYIDDLFYHLQQQYSDLAQEKDIQIRSFSTAQQVFADPKYLERMLGNLVHNAIKHAQGADNILLGVRRRQQGVQLEVWDNGQGIPSAEQDKIFQAFYQLDNPERHHRKGVGLGLAIVKQLADVMGCQIKLHSTLGKGSCFALHFPASGQIADTPSQPQNAPEPAIEDFNTAYNILLIEDDERIAEALAALLSSWGLQVKTAPDRASALQILDTFSPDALLLDYQLPQQDNGLSVLAALQQRLNTAPPCVLLTGSSDEASLALFAQLDFPVLFKPIDPQRLKAVLRQLWEH